MKTLPPCDHDECPPTRCLKTANAKGVGSGELLCCVEQELYLIAAKLGELRDKLAAANETLCAWEIEQTLRALSEACRATRRAKLNEPLPTVEDVQAIYRQYGEQHNRPS